MKRCRRASSAVRDRLQSLTVPPPRLRLSRCCSEPPTRTANHRVGRHVLTRLAHRLDVVEACLEDERHDQIIGPRPAPARVPRAAAAASRQRGAAADEWSTVESARSAPAEPIGCIYCTWRRTSHMSRHSRGWSRRLRAKEAVGAQRRYGEKGGQRAPNVNVNDASE